LTILARVRTLSHMRRGTPKFRLKGCEAVVQEVRTRMPFGYGKAQLTVAPLLHARVLIESSDGKFASGISADCLPPQWFDKDPAKTYRQEVESQIGAFQKAAVVYVSVGKSLRTAVDLWLEAYPKVLEEAYRSGINALTASFGSSFVERAIVDAVCRLRGVSFFEALRQDLLGFKTSEHLPAKLPDAIFCRHTVGLCDRLTAGEIPEKERVKDGLPQALEEDIETYGLRYFKIKLSGEHERDLERLSRIAALLHQRCKSGYRLSLDGNEQYRDLKDLERLIEDLRSKPYGTTFFDSILFIEQPLPRDIALTASVAGALEGLSRLKPVIVDESDDLPDSFERAAKLGYRGVSHKNCKGLFKSLQNRALICRLNGERKENFYFQTAEDLSTLPVVALQQDLASALALGIEHVERNGHHYFRGLDHLPKGEAAAALAAHSDLYEERQGSVFLHILDGMIACGSIQCTGYGYASEVAIDERTQLAAWTPAGLEP